MPKITIKLSEKAYRGLQYASECAGKSMQELAVQSIRESFPSLLEVMPPHAELKSGAYLPAKYFIEEK